MWLNSIFKVARWFWQLWSRLDEQTKRKIVETMIVVTFEELLRAFYRTWRKFV